MQLERQLDRLTIDKKIKTLQNNQNLPQELVTIVSLVARGQVEAVQDATIQIPAEGFMTSSDDLRRGKPLIGREHFPADRKQAGELFDIFADMFEQTAPLDNAVKKLRQEIQAGSLSIEESMDSFLKGDDRIFREMEKKTPSSPRCLNFLIQSSLAPGLWKGASLLGKHLPEDLSWAQGYCPLCGSPPLIGELRSKEGIRFLTCSFCSFEYRAMRLSCPFCGENGSGKLEYFDSPDEHGFMVEVCNTCKYYIKTIDYRKLDRKSVPELDDLLSLPFDVLAQKKGFSRPTLSAWGF